MRPHARRGGVRRHAQLDVRRRPAGLAAHAAGEGDTGTARGRHPRAADRHVLRQSRPRRGVQNIPIAKIDERLGPDREEPLTSTSATRSAASGRPARPTRLRDVREFLAAHPREVLLISIEDYVRPRDVASVFERSGLDRYVWRGPLEPRRFPTLREMIDKDERVVVMAENLTAGGVPWLRDQFDLVQETPYRFAHPRRGGRGELLSPQPRQRPEPAVPAQQLGRHIAASRGRATPPWSTRYDALLRRARMCQELRGPPPEPGRRRLLRAGRRAGCRRRPQPLSWTHGVWSFPRNVVQRAPMESAITPATASCKALAAAQWPAPFYSWRFS